MWMIVVPVLFFGADGNVSFGFATKEQCVEMSERNLVDVLDGMGLDYRIDPSLICYFEPGAKKDA